MSAITSPSSIDGHHHRLTGFNEHSLDDPFLSTIAQEEHLLQLSSTIATSAAQEAHGTKSRNSDNLAGNLSRTPINLPSNSLPYFHHNSATNDRAIQRRGFPTSYTSSTERLQHHSASLSPTTASDFLSPTAIYSTDAGYSELSGITTPNLEDDFLLEANFGLIPELRPDEDLQYSIKSDGLYSQYSLASEPQSPPYAGREGPSLLRTLDKSSTLLSPVLTNSPSPPSKVEEYRHIDMDPAPTSALMTESPVREEPVATSTYLEPPVPEFRRTPALTGSPTDNAFEAETAKHTARGISPVVRIESYSRGDSPARSATLGRSASKRSRTSRSSAHLSPYAGAESSEGEVEYEQRNAGLRYAAVAPSAPPLDYGLPPPAAAVDRTGVDPEMRSQLNEAQIPNLLEQEESRQIAEKNAEVRDWLAHSEVGSVGGLDQPSTESSNPKKSGERRRARSMGNFSASRPNVAGLEAIDKRQGQSSIPGPGLLLTEESDNEEDEPGDTDEELSESPPAIVDPYLTDQAISGVSRTPVDQEAFERPSYRTHPWEDPPYDSFANDMQAQPATANAAIMRFKLRADNLETASRAATWGTRRMSETDLDKIVGDGGLFKRLSFGKDKEKTKGKGERRGSFLEQAATKLLPKRSNSKLRRQTVPQPQRTQTPDPQHMPRKESAGSLALPKPGKTAKYPDLNTGSAVIAMTGQIAAIGRSGSISATAAPSPRGAWTQAKSVIKRSRSRSELGDAKSANLELAGLMSRHGGPPMPTLASPPKEVSHAEPFGPPAEDQDEELEEVETEDAAVEETGVSMDLTVRADDVEPTFEGFKRNVCQLNPRLAPYLVDRIGQEQVRRYKKLLASKVQHLNAVGSGNCASGKYCFALGGQASTLPPKVGIRDPETPYAGPQAGATATSDNESTSFGEGVVTAAQFPPGLPLPPVNRLPTEFECPLCFKVKKFHKPSDWTKHVHEDLQPFTCTFPNCADPKSFKRKADWVRHENERHRQLEWWKCNMPDCSHTCYRKDNFVQHLVREHKMQEPKIKAMRTPARPSGRAGTGTAQAEVMANWHATSVADTEQSEVDKLWALVEECHYDTPKLPRDEACKFCGNVCTSWKKLTVHVGKHMEQISMPILRLVEQKDVTSDTIISPIEQRVPKQRQSPSPTAPVRMPKFESLSSSPSGIPAYILPQAGNSSGSFEMDAPGVYDDDSSRLQATNPYIGTENYNNPSTIPTSMPGYSEPERPSFLVSDYPAYREHPQQSFVPINAAHGYGSVSGHAVEPTAGYASAHGQVSFYNPQPHFPPAMGGEPYLYHNPEGFGPIPPVSTAPTASYDPNAAISFSGAPSGSSSQYVPPRQDYLYRRQ